MATKPKLVLVDTMGIIHRAFHAYPQLTTTDGKLVNAVYGFGIMFMQIMKMLKPEYLVFASDLKEKTFRSEKYVDYKAQRGPMDEGLVSQIPIIYDFIDAIGLPMYKMEGYEADDIIGSISRKYSKDFDIHIVTGDKDLLQLIDDNVTVILPGKSFSDMREYHEKEFQTRFGFPSKNYINYKALIGDASDNIKGAKGIGEKTATGLIQDYNTLGGIFENLDNIKERYRKILEEYKDLLITNLDIVTIDCNIKIDIDKDKSNLKNLDLKDTVEFLQKYEFSSLLTQFKKIDTKVEEIIEEKQDREVIKFKKQENNSLPNFLIVKKSEKSDSNDLFADAKNDKVFSFDDKYNYSVESSAPKKGFTFNAKLIYHEQPDSLNNNYDDLQLLSYCMNPEYGDAEILKIYKKLFHKEIIDVYDVDIEDEYKSTAFEAIAFNQILEKVNKEIGKQEKKVYDDIDLPLVPVLARMEILGMKVNVPYLQRLDKIFNKKIDELKVKIFECVGHEFNPNSPKELSVILFDELGLPKVKKTKTGYSTDERTIGKLSGTHPIIDLILEYREYNKLLSTYVVALQKVVEKDRIHTELRQTSTSTGRLSSINPNLQNIPTRSETGELIRKAFTSDDGKTLLSLDYSQIDLRTMAHVSGDEAMIEAFKEGKDIHASTAAAMFNIEEKDVTSEQRRVAKMINFGIIYGISDFGLSDRLGPQFNVKIAKDFIQKYFERYPKIKAYFDTVKDEVAEKGYVETMFGRRRYFNLEVGNYMVKQAMFREAINMPVQGADSDIVKLAMIEVQKLIDEKYEGKVKMLLQIHDELLFEMDDDEKLMKNFVKEASDKMENVVSLSVPMVVNSKAGRNWGEMH